MAHYRIELTKERLLVHTELKGKALLQDSFLNKGTAFTLEERKHFQLEGLLPLGVETIEVQLTRAYRSYQRKESDLERHIFLRNLQDYNETLFYRLIMAHISEMLPIIYTPVVGEACQHFHQIFRRSRGLFLSYPQKDNIEAILANIDLPEVKVIVVTDGERILGLGDQGVGGIGISIGKTSLYTACGGIFPGFTLPIVLDVGTDNEERLKDPLYFGWKERRVRGKEYEQFVDLFVTAIMKRFPRVLLQWEDFSKDYAHLFLSRYRDRLCTFNDDIQGTAAVTLAGILAALRITKKEFKEQNILFYGSGSAGVGIATALTHAMTNLGLTEQEAKKRIWMISRKGLIHNDLHPLPDFQQIFAQDKERLKSLGFNVEKPIEFEEVIEQIHPTI